ncbi:MAG: ThuA domain-containing protein [Methanomicrobiales archaeon]|nr:ThuA domain-containing protein [Methanomicrobiales archaeon]
MFISGTSYAQVTVEERNRIWTAIPEQAPAAPAKPRKILVVNLHVWDGQVAQGHISIPYGNLALKWMGERTGAFETVFTDDTLMFLPENLRKFDAVCFNNTVGVLFEDPVLRKSLLDFVADGKGFIGLHAAAATYVQWPEYGQFPEYGEMIGGYENGGHPWKPYEWIVLRVEEPGHPVMQAFQRETFPVSDEVFQFQKPYSRDKLRVLLVIDPVQTNINEDRHILPERRGDLDLAVSWIREYGKGRVFYSALGHNPHIFWDRDILGHFLAGIQFALGDLNTDARPSNRVPGKQNRR